MIPLSVVQIQEGIWALQPVFVSDAIATFDRTGPDGVCYKAEDIHAMTLLHQEFATIVDTQSVLKRVT